MKQTAQSTAAVDMEVWWLHPGWLVLAMGLVLIPAAYLIPDGAYRSYWRMPKLVDLRTMNTCLLCIMAFAAGAFAGGTRSHTTVLEHRFTWTQHLPWPLLFQLFCWSFYLTLAGYLVWGASAVARGLNAALVLGVLHGEKGTTDLVKEVYMVTISGVTTLTQFGLVGVVLGGAIGCVHGWKHVRVKVAVIFALAVVRALLNSERLAVIELSIPLALVVIRLAILDSPRLIGWLRLLVAAAPVYAGGVLLGLFGASEYFRSWLNYYAGGDLNFFEFISLRLLGYYVTAINNGALLIERLQPTGAPFFTLHFLWRFPLLSNLVETAFPNVPFTSADDPYMTVLGVGANAEFNNGGGYLLPVLDYGVLGAFLYWLVMGLLCGWLYRLFCRKHILGLLVFPVAFIGVTEMPRILYWAEGRVFPAFVTLGILSYVCVKYRERSQDLQLTRAHGLGETLHV